MTRDDIIKLAREAGFVANVGKDCNSIPVPYAKLCHPTPTSTALFNMLERFAALVAAHEREMCARVADAEAEESVDCCYSLAVRVSSAIRARGETK